MQETPALLLLGLLLISIWLCVMFVQQSAHGGGMMPLVIMTGIATFFLLIFQWLLINFVRGEFLFPKEIWYNIGTSALLSMLISPAVFAGLHWLAGKTHYQISYEGLYRRKSDQAA